MMTICCFCTLPIHLKKKLYLNFEPQLVLEYSLDSERQNILHSKYVVVPPIYSEVKVVSQNFIRTTVRLDQDFGFS